MKGANNQQTEALGTNLINIVVVNYNAGSLLRECVDSIFSSTHANFVLHVVDNASKDDSLANLPQDPRCRVLRQAQNLGFAKAVNVGFMAREVDWYLVLNPDTLIESGTLAQSVAYMTLQPEIGVLGVGHTNHEGRLVPSNSRVPTPLRLFLSRVGLRRPILFGHMKPMKMVDQDLELSSEVDQVMGAYMFVRGEVINNSNILMDEDYFLYYEDVQFCYDVRRAGYRVTYNPDIRIYHYGQGTTENMKATRLVYSAKSSVLFADKNFGLLGRIFARLAVYVIEPLARLLKAGLHPQRGRELSEWREAYHQIWTS